MLLQTKNKFQTGSESTDEKLQTRDFKRKQYVKLMAPLNIEVEYIYILSDWFRNAKYKDVLDYIISVGCQYYFKYLPLQKIRTTSSKIIKNTVLIYFIVRQMELKTKEGSDPSFLVVLDVFATVELAVDIAEAFIGDVGREFKILISLP